MSFFTMDHFLYLLAVIVISTIWYFIGKAQGVDEGKRLRPVEHREIERDAWNAGYWEAVDDVREGRLNPYELHIDADRLDEALNHGRDD